MEKYADKLTKDRIVDAVETNRDEIIVEEIKDALGSWYEESPSAQDKAQELLTSHDATDFVNWFINGRYIQNIEDVKKLFYISENKPELVDMVISDLTNEDTETIAEDIIDENEEVDRPQFNRAVEILNFYTLEED